MARRDRPRRPGPPAAVVPAPSGPGGAPACQLALAFLSLTGLHHDPEAIIAASLGPHQGQGEATRASPFMHHHVFAALMRLGRPQDIRRIIAHLWGTWGDLATTPENWDISFPDGSAAHGFSAHPLYWLKVTTPEVGQPRSSDQARS